MPIITSKEGEVQGVMRAAGLMMVACRTAPKSGGVDDTETVLISGEEKDRIAAEMEKMGDERKIEGFKRDADNVKRSVAVLLVGVNGRRSYGVSCGGAATPHAKGLTLPPEFPDKILRGLPASSTRLGHSPWVRCENRRGPER